MGSQTTNSECSTVSMSIGDSPGQRPSYVNVDLTSTSGLYPPQHDFDERVIKKLDLEFDDTVNTTENAADTTAEDEKLKTFLRIRPISNGFADPNTVLEVKDANTVTVYTNPRSVHLCRGPKQTDFKFSKILGPECGQSTVFEECVTPMIEKFLRNENCLVFSYGATNSGKTYTMQGYGNEYGIIPRTLDAIFSRIQDRQYKVGNIRPHLYQSFLQLSPTEVNAIHEKRNKVMNEANIKQEIMSSYRLSSSGFSDKSGSTVNIVGGHIFDPNNELYTNSTLYSVWVSYAELYNERVYDLFDNTVGLKNKRRKELKLMQDRNGFVYIKDLTEFPVTSDEDAYKLFLAGRKNLQFAATQMNQNSSRSHSFFTIRVVTLGIGDGLTPYPKTVHRLTFCDLAGMERANQTENEGFRLKESGNINNSLTVLLKVIRVLREKQTNQGANTIIETIPFRESKLTHIFKSYLTSSTHICMVVNVNPDPAVIDSTVQVLQNSAIASNVIVFRPMDLNNQGHPANGWEKNRPIAPIPPHKRSERGGKRPLEEDSEESESDADEYAVATVVAPRTLHQKIRILENEVTQLRQMLVDSEAEKQKLRDDMFKMLSEERSQWCKRIQDIRLVEENFNRRRLSLMRQQLSPGSRCGRCGPPISDMEDIDETFEEEEEEMAEGQNEEAEENQDNKEN